MRYTIISFIKVRTSSYLLIDNQVFKLLVVTAFFVDHLHAYLCLMHAMTSSRHNNRPSNSVNSKLVIVVFTNHSVEAPVHEPNWIRGCNVSYKNHYVPLPWEGAARIRRGPRNKCPSSDLQCGYSLI